ncbi:hypothetical protein O4160_13600 [Rhodococcus sp. IEGM 1401]|uniref:hypothetical protein n=1 Tax=unclassified Rhodococcus (in: high G+C Gram-positive bacteria) TaxID=192944 RepID=UPI001FB1DF51|nr:MULTISPECIES: hypothetical protein [unclassified Rhodococcus (in: high G+C Gram-positive bacteria)]MCJ0894378.1 hypothetical protein [Rhodococcus sp. ARC_M5]MCJ0980587.1 hypothetical protein [Rhodococcus sp. ARC_M12]MCZ4561870.1 hypothetical protein [Rhodococcus sp. IEGM 1401]MDI9921953.1 hypothetical protein [Rhodococcus sp. IEGM 1372]MDV8034465.1 hypothetical protein [Rhodococcus sp. IEGM 1414]
MKIHALRKTLTITALLGAVTLAVPGAAHAETVTGWVGPAGSNGAGVQFLNTSTIINSPNLTAQSKIYSVFGQQVAPGDIGVRARLFKSGALCEAVGYKYSFTGAASLTIGTTATCGTGSYNSHGFTAVWDGVSAYREALTFPSNPVNWTAPAARSAAPSATDETTVESGTNASGQSYGAGDTAANDAELPDLVAAIGTDGVQGFIEKSALDTAAASPDEATALEKQNVGGTDVLGSAPKTVPVYASDGTTQISEFTIS